MVDYEVASIIAKFKDALISAGIQVEKVLLYGSYATENRHAGSDIDLAVISPDFGKDRYEEGKKLFQVAWRIDPRIEPVPVSSESFENDTWLPLIHEIREKGIEFQSSSPGAELDRCK